MISKDGLYLCIKEVPEELFESVRPCYGYLFKFRGQLPKNGCISLGSVYPNEKISVHIDPEFFEEYFREITKMIIIDHEPTDCFRCPLSYRYHNTEDLDEPEWQTFCSVDGEETVYLDDDGETYKYRTDCPAHRVEGR